jgi:hypothetical protein
MLIAPRSNADQSTNPRPEPVIGLLLAPDDAETSSKPDQMKE